MIDTQLLHKDRALVEHLQGKHDQSEHTRRDAGKGKSSGEVKAGADSGLGAKVTSKKSFSPSDASSNSDMLPFEFTAKSNTGFSVEVKHHSFPSLQAGKTTYRAWMIVRNPKDKIVKDTPVQGVYQYSRSLGGFISGPGLGISGSKRATSPVTPQKMLNDLDTKFGFSKGHLGRM